MLILNRGRYDVLNADYLTMAAMKLTFWFSSSKPNRRIKMLGDHKLISSGTFKKIDLFAAF